jgi:hypothetical protein
MGRGLILLACGSLLAGGCYGASASPPPTGAPALQRITATIRDAASQAGFAVDSVRLTRHARAGTTILTVASRQGWLARADTFGRTIAGLRHAGHRVGWTLLDSCGNVVARVSKGVYVNPRWACPNPWATGLVMPAGECKKLAAQAPMCR